MISILPMSTMAIKCQSSFYDSTDFFKSEYSLKLRQNFQIFKINFDQLNSFMGDNEKNNYKSYYFNSYLEIKKVTDFFINKFQNDDLLRYLLNEEDSIIQVGYKNGNSIVENPDFEFLKFQLKPFSENNQIPLNLQIRYLDIINTEINKIMDDWSNWIPNNSALKRYVNAFLNNPGWPFFNNSNYSEEDKKFLENEFYKEINDSFNEMKNEYSQRYFNKHLSSIDYSTILVNTSSLESNNKHTHALINLWREWNSATSIYNINNELKYNKNNKVVIIKKFIDSFFNIIEDKNIDKPIFIKISKDNKSVEINFSEFMTKWKAVYNNSELIKMHNNEKEFEEKFIFPINEMIRIAHSIFRIIQSYKSS
ncbi:MAG0770 family lipoprotein [Mycoplasmopsis lipofaciens]|uniref:MAG0770 family lipoprotein n=1 Tax=Mycoplasmopsis lipofaciens TaxID=114884 RepID=UPI0012EBD0CA|nr:hypothetical protein [Mycoplasmopsis lipofaciens]